MTAPPHTAVACFGNDDRGDDGFGPAVARALFDLHGEALTVRNLGQDTLGLLELCTAYPRVIVVDAAVTGQPPGTLLCPVLQAGTLPAELAGSSTHRIGAATAIGLARALGQLPQHLELVVAEAQSFALGAPLSPPVARCVAPAVAHIRAGAGLGGREP